MKLMFRALGVFCVFCSSMLLAGEKEPNSYADKFPSVPKGAKVLVLPLAYDFSAVPSEIPLIESVLFEQLKALGYSPAKIKIDPVAGGGNEKLFFLVNTFNEQVRPAKQQYLVILKAQVAFDIAIIPAVVSRTAKLSGQMAIWDHVKNRVQVKGFGGGASTEWSGSQQGLSLEVDAYDAEGNWLFTSYGGISVPYYMDTRNSVFVLKEHLFEDKKDRKYLDEGVESALEPLTKKIKFVQ
jgi:hypothetical protein